MPFYKDNTNYGNLIVEFHVEMPKRGDISKDNLATLAKVLPGKINERPKDDKYEMLEDFDLQNVNTNEEGGRKDEEEEEVEGEGIQCGQQ